MHTAPGRLGEVRRPRASRGWAGAAALAWLGLAGCGVLGESDAESRNGGLSVGERNDLAPASPPRSGYAQGTPSAGSSGGDVQPTPDAPAPDAGTASPDRTQLLEADPSTEPPALPPSLPACEPPASAPGAELAFTIEWQWQGDPSSEPGLPLVANLTDDDGNGVVDRADTPDVVMQEQVGGLSFVLDGATGAEHARIAGTSPFGTQPAIGDVDGDGTPEIVGVQDLTLVVHDASGAELWRAPPLEENTGTGSITLADLDGDGLSEVLTDGVVYSATGRHLRTLTLAGDVAPPVAADLDGDGLLEVLYGGGSAYHLDGSPYFSASAGGEAFAQVADLDGDQLPEVILIGEIAVLVLDHAGHELARADFPSPDPSLGVMPSYAPAVLADVDGDGLPEIGVAGSDTYRMFRADLSLLWSTPTDRGAFVLGSTAFDFDGDDTPEIVYADFSRLHVYDGATGAERWGYDISGSPGIGYPVIADVDGDGSAEILLAVHDDRARLLSFGAASGSFMPARRIWNQYNYHVGHVNEDGSLPARAFGSWLLGNTFRAQARVDAGGEVCAPRRVSPR